MSRAHLAWAFAAALVIGSIGCAKDDVSSEPEVDGPRPGAVGWACSKSGDCDSGFCLPAGRCSAPCESGHDCPDVEGWSCGMLPSTPMLCLCEPAPGGAEACNGRDDDCDGVADNGALCDDPLEACVDGRCTCPEARRCDGRCVDPEVDPHHCGECGNRCPGGAACEGGTCACAEGHEVCDDRCVDTSVDPKHCGGCRNACGSGEGCTDGACTCLDTVCAGVCTDRKSDPENCGECWKSCLGGACVAGACQPKEFVGDVSPYGPLVLDGDHLYFGTYNDIRRIRRNGTGQSQVLQVLRMKIQADYINQNAFSLDDQYVFWTSWSPDGIHRSYRSGGGFLKIANGLGGTATDGAYVYFLARGEPTDRPFIRASRDGTDPVPLMDSSTYYRSSPASFVLDDTYAYVNFQDRIERVPKAGGQAEVIARSSRIRSLMVTDDRIFWSDAAQIQSVKKTGGSISKVFSCDGAQGWMAIEGGDLFWICGQSLYTKPLSGGQERVLVRGIDNHEQEFDSALAVDSDAVYYTEWKRIMRLAR